MDEKNNQIPSDQNVTSGAYDSRSLNQAHKVERVNDPYYSEYSYGRNPYQMPGAGNPGNGRNAAPGGSGPVNPGGGGPVNPGNGGYGQRPERPKKRKGKSKSFGKTAARTVAIALIFGLVAGGTFEGVHYGTSAIFGNSASESTTESASSKSDQVKTQQVSDTSGSSQTVDYDVADVVKKTEPSIVSITTTVTTNYQYFYQNYEQEAEGAGSGIIIGKSDKQLYIATNYHVIENANEIHVGFNDGEVVSAEVKGYDEDADIAAVAVNFSDMKDSTAKSVTIATVGDSDKLQVGEPAIAIGNALGYGQSVTVGYISALNRTVDGSNGTFIQTDAAINPGNSGGALINAKGEVIGINSAKYADTKVEGMGFSIPINTAMSIIQNILSGKNTGSVYLGISGVDVSSEYSQIYGFPEGIYVKEVEKGSPAEKAGLHTGDIIVEFDGQEVYTIEDLQKEIRSKNAGDKTEITVYRADTMGNYEKTKVEATLQTKTD